MKLAALVLALLIPVQGAWAALDCSADGLLRGHALASAAAKKPQQQQPDWASPIRPHRQACPCPFGKL